MKNAINGKNGIKHFSLRYSPPFSRYINIGINRTIKVRVEAITLFFFLVTIKYSRETNPIIEVPIEYVPLNIECILKLGFKSDIILLLELASILPVSIGYAVGNRKKAAKRIPNKTTPINFAVSKVNFLIVISLFLK